MTAATTIFRRPKSTSGFWGWATTIDHKKIGIMYGVASLFFFLVGGFEAMLIRLQLAVPGNDLLSADLYNQVFTMHGLTMVFLVVMPLAAAFANYLLPPVAPRVIEPGERGKIAYLGVCAGCHTYEGRMIGQFIAHPVQRCYLCGEAPLIALAQKGDRRRQRANDHQQGTGDLQGHAGREGRDRVCGGNCRPAARGHY